MNTKLVIQGWDKNGDAEQSFVEYKNKYLLRASYSLIPKDGRYHHFAVIKDESNETVFIDGKMIDFK